MRVFTLAGIALAIAAAPWSARAQTVTEITICDRTGASQALLSQASKSARLTFLAARIETHWSIAEDSALPPGNDSGNGLEILVAAKLLLRPEANSGFLTAGAALPNPPYPRAYAFLDAVAAVSERTTRSESDVLACVFVHEIGHLLGLAHARDGAMRAVLDGDG